MKSWIVTTVFSQHPMTVLSVESVSSVYSSSTVRILKKSCDNTVRNKLTQNIFGFINVSQPATFYVFNSRNSCSHFNLHIIERKSQFNIIVSKIIFHGNLSEK